MHERDKGEHAASAFYGDVEKLALSFATVGRVIAFSRKPESPFSL